MLASSADKTGVPTLHACFSYADVTILAVNHYSLSELIVNAQTRKIAMSFKDPHLSWICWDGG